MLDLAHEKRIPLSEAPRHPLLLRRPRPPIHRSVLERWRTRGVGGIILETIKIGGVRYTTEEAISRFIERCSTPGAASDTVTPQQIAKAHLQAERELDAAGM